MKFHVLWWDVKDANILTVLLTMREISQREFLCGQNTSWKKGAYEMVEKVENSKKQVHDIRALLWVVTVGGLLLAAYCVRTGYAGALPWLSAMVGLPWTAHGTVCAFYLNMAKSDHKEGGITYESTKAAGFQQVSEESPTI